MGFGLGKVAGIAGGALGLSTLTGGGLTDALGGILGSQTGATVLQTYANDYFNRKAAKKQFGYTRALMDYENEYNTPKNQMERLDEAGLNPNLVYGNGGTTIASAHGTAPNVKPTQLDLLTAYNLDEQNELLKEQIARTRTENLLTGRKANLLYYQDKYAEKEYESFQKTGKIPESYYKNQSEPQFILRLLENMIGSSNYWTK